MNIGEKFDLEKLAEELTEQYQGKGFQVRTIKMKNSVKIVLSKNCGGINMLLGLGLGISVTCTIMGKEKDMLSIAFSEGDWTGKIIGLCIGWCVCLIPFITSLVGVFKQLSFSKDITNDVQMIVGSMDE